MASKLTARLVFEGGEGVAKQLLELGRIGTKAFNDISKAAGATGVAFQKFSSDVDRLKRQVAAVGVAAAQVGRGFSQVGSGVATAGRRIGLATAAVAGFAAATFEVAKAGAEAADQAGKLASRAGLSVESFTQLAFAFEQDGISAEDFAGSMRILNKNIGEALSGNKQQVELFRKMGIRLRENNGKFVGQAAVIGQIAEAFRRFPDGIGKSNAAVELFGRSGASLIPTLNQGVLGLREMSDQARTLGRVITREQAVLGDDFGDAIDRTGAALKGLEIQLGLTFAPQIIKAADFLTDAIVRNRDAIISSIAQGWAKLVQVVQDVFNAFKGKDTAVVNDWILTARDNFILFRDTVSGAFENVIFPIIERLREVFRVVAEEINRLFGTNLSGDQLALAVFLLQITGLFQSLIGVVNIAVGAFGLLTAGVRTFIALFPLIVSGSALAGSALRTLFTGVIAVLEPVVVAIAGLVGWPALIVAGLTVAAVAIVAYWDDIKEGLQGVWDFAKTVANGIAEAFRGVKRVVGGVVDAITGDRQSGSIDVQRRAKGGILRGPGTGTSDSMLVRASTGEYWINAQRVKQFGQSFFDAINFGGFVPAFAEGGAVGGRPVNISLDGQSFRLSGSTDVVDTLTRAARQKAVRQFVKPPGWSTKR